MSQMKGKVVYENKNTEITKGVLQLVKKQITSTLQLTAEKIYNRSKKYKLSKCMVKIYDILLCIFQNFFILIQ